MRKLSTAQIDEIRDTYWIDPDQSRKELAAKYGITPKYLGDIIWYNVRPDTLKKKPEATAVIVADRPWASALTREA